jgi:hypothetical protein
MSIHSLYVGIFHPSGEPISLHLLRCGPIAVDDHSFMGHALHLQQPRLVNNPRKVLFLMYFLNKKFQDGYQPLYENPERNSNHLFSNLSSITDAECSELM